jgi:1-acyl-sn-glycerol-3-phosphate acyltransferase
MQRIVIDQPYRFVPPRFSRFWYGMIRRTVPGRLRKEEGIRAIECVGTEKLRASFDAGHGVMLVPNHCRPNDPLVLDALADGIGRAVHHVASWHLFMNSRIQRFLLPRVGVFSVYREGTDRESLRCAINTIAEGKFPLAVFAEGIITRSNDRLLDFMDGPAFIARAAAKKRSDGKVAVHPVFTRYFFEGDLQQSLAPVLESIERLASLEPLSGMPLRERIIKTGDALLAIKETEHLGAPASGTCTERLQHLIEHILRPLEARWVSGLQDGDPIARSKRLRAAIVPGIVEGGISADDRAARWRMLADLYLVQQLHCYPPGYLDRPTPERLLETVDRYEEDLTDKTTAHFPLRAVITVGDAVEVGPTRDRSQDADPVTVEVRSKLESMMESSKSARTIEPTGTSLS